MSNNKSEKPDFSRKVPFLDSNENEKLWGYIKNVWENTAQYKVMMSNRMLNLNHVLMEEWGAYNNKEYSIDNIMSDNAFLLEAKAIANRYSWRNRFPSILICDDVMMHGRRIMDMLNKFLDIVSDQLAKNHVDVSRNTLISDLQNSVNVYVYARNRNERLIFDINKYRLYSEQVLIPSDLNTLSRQISIFLYTYGISNTNYVISGKLDYSQTNRLFDKTSDKNREMFKYKGLEQSIYLRARNPYFLETICFERLTGRVSGKLTSQPIFSVLPIDDLNKLCVKVASYMKKFNSESAVAFDLEQNNDKVIEQKAQMLCFFYSVLSMADFCWQYLNPSDLDLFRILRNGNYNSVISNFDTNIYYRYEIYNFIKEICLNPSESKVLWGYLDSIFNSFDFKLKYNINGLSSERFVKISVPNEYKMNKIYNSFEEIFCDRWLDSEYCANKNLKKWSFENGLKYSIIGFLRLMNIFKEYDFEQKIGCLFGPLALDIFSMSLETSKINDKMIIRTILTSDKMAIYNFFNKFSDFLPALVEVESYSNSNGLYLRDVTKEFISYIQNCCFQGDQMDRELIKELNNCGMLLYSLSCGISFKDINIDYRTLYQYLFEKDVRYKSQRSKREEQERRYHYLNCARTFIEKQKTLSRKMRND